MPAQGPSRLLLRLAVSWVAALQLVPQLPGGQGTTDPQSPKGGSQRACHTRGLHPMASGRLAVAVRSLSLRNASPGSESSPSSFGRFLPFHRFLLRYLSFSVDDLTELNKSGADLPKGSFVFNNSNPVCSGHRR